MKKRIAGLLAAAMVLTMSMSVFAAGSITAKDVAAAEEAVGEVKGVEGLTTEAVSVEVLTEAVAEAEKLVEKEDADEVKVLGAVEITVPAGTGKSTITIEVEGITAADTKETIQILHKDGTKWETITPDKVEEGKVTATFDSFSPVVIVRVPVKADVTGIVTVLPLVAVACVGGIAACAKKENE